MKGTFGRVINHSLQFINQFTIRSRSLHISIKAFIHFVMIYLFQWKGFPTSLDGADKLSLVKHHY